MKVEYKFDRTTRPKRPYPYIEPDKRAKNTTPRDDKYWNELVKKSHEFDEELKQWQGTAIEELTKKAEPERPSFISKTHLIKLIVSEYEFLNNRSFDTSDDSITFIRLLIDYHFNHEVFGEKENIFSQSKLLTRSIGAEKIDIRLNKSLFVVGGFGVGKTSITKAFQSVIFNSHERLIKDVNNHDFHLRTYKDFYTGFHLVTAREIVAMKDKKQEDRYEDIIKYKNVVIDDLFAEDKSFGKEVLVDFMERRYENKETKTHIICNYATPENKIQDVLAPGGAYQLRYGDRLFDRAFEMYNVVEMKGKSKRK